MRRKYSPNPKWDTPAFWTKVGEICLRLSARPDHYVQAQFAADKNRHGPFPNAIAGKVAERRYIEWLEQHRLAEHQGERSSQMSLDVSLIAKEISRANEACEDIFPGQPRIVGYRSPMTEIPAWLRVLVGYRDAETWRRWGESGREEIMSNPLLMSQCAAVGLPVRQVLEFETKE